MTDLAFTDAHVHFFDLRDRACATTGCYPRPTKTRSRELRRDQVATLLAATSSAETRFANVTKVVHVQAAVGTPDPVDETRWLQAFADRLGVPQGIVAYADLASADAEGVLSRHVEFASVRGIRDLRYDDYLRDEAWQRGYALLERHGLVCCDDPLVEAMPDAAELARMFPAVTYCVDHAGFPRRRDREYFAEWRRACERSPQWRTRS